MIATRRISVRAIAVACCWALVLQPVTVSAGDLNAEVNNMFTSLGGVGNYTAPGAFKGQTFNTYTGGNLYLRTPNKTYTLAAVAFPSVKAGCGGIDVFGGSFSHLSAAEFKNMLQNITAALPGIAFQLALEAVSPLLGGLTKWAKGFETMLTNARINSCEQAKALVSSAAEAVGFDAQEACAKLAVQMGLEPDYSAARVRCASDRPAVLNSARTSTNPDDRELAPFVGNLTWESLKKVDTLDDAARELVMSLIGTYIYYAEPSSGPGRPPQYVAPTVTTVSHLLYGQNPAAGGNINIQLLKCNNYSTCDEVTAPTTYVHEPFTVKVENLMRSISDAIRTRTALPNDSQEVGFVNRTSEPVWRMLSVGNTIPGSGIAETMIAKYREIIAADYAFNFFQQYIRLATSAANHNQYRLNKPQLEDVGRLRGDALHRMTQLAQEKSNLYAKQGSVTAVSMQLEQLERQLRSTMPQHVMDMLGHSSQAKY